MEKSKHLPKAADENTATLNDQSLSENEVRRRLATYIPQKGNHDSKFIFGENNAKNHIEKGTIDKKTTIFISNCEGGEVIIDAMCTKVMIQGCKGIKVVCNGVVLTNSVEVWACEDVVLEVNEILVATLQVDLCKNFKVSFSRRKLFHKLIWASVDGYSITFKDIEKQLLEKEKEEEKGEKKEGEKKEVKAVFTNSYDEMVKRYPDEEFQKNIAQFIDSLEENGEVRSEKLLRLQNGFPTTEREQEEFDERSEKNKKIAEEHYRGIINKIENDKDLKKLGIKTVKRR